MSWLLFFSTCLMSLVVGTGVGLLEIYVFPGRTGRLSFPVSVLLKTGIYLGVVLVAIGVLSYLVPFLQRLAFLGAADLLAPGFEEEQSGLALIRLNVREVARFVGLTLLICFVVVFTNQLNALMGRGVLGNLLTGKYYRPVEEDRIFMFLDIRASTQLAEKLGNLPYSQLISDFFADVGEPILETRGEVYQYVGDEVVVTWPLGAGVKGAWCLRCFYRIKQKIQARSGYYLATYGVVPGFKAGMHCGKVVTTQVGSVKSELVYHGDVLNTTARIQALCNAYGCELLLSEALLGQLNIPGERASYRWQGFGAVRLRGKKESIRLWGVRPWEQDVPLPDGRRTLGMNLIL
jgi:class 3 adenylate cyclase